MGKTGPKQIAISIVALLAIAASGWVIYRQTRPEGINVKLHRVIGEVLAEQAALVTTNRGKVVVVHLDRAKYPVINAQLEGFESGLQKFPDLKLYRTVEVDAEGKPKYGPGRGLSGERFLRIVKKYSGRADVIVSFIGTPTLTEEEFKNLRQPMPKFVAETRAREQLAQLFAANAVHAAIVPRFIFPSPVQKPKTPRDWFDEGWQVINPSNVPADDAPDDHSESAAENAPKKNNVKKDKGAEK